MAEETYKRNKFKTVCEIISRIENWPTALDLRVRKHRPGLAYLQFRDGLKVVSRRDTQDWKVIHEICFANSYARAMDWLKARPGRPVVLDLGGHMGLFSLTAARTHPGAEIHAYEPGPPNFRLFEINRLVNEEFTDRIHLHKEAVSGTTRTAEWFYNAGNSGGSSLFGASGPSFPVQIRAFAEVMASLPSDPELVKIDIEGAEFELISRTPPELWQRIKAISLELHHDPENKIPQEEFLKRMAGFGFEIEKESVITYFLHRRG